MLQKQGSAVSCQGSMFLQFIKKTETNVSNVKRWILLFRKDNVVYNKRFQTNSILLFIGSVAEYVEYFPTL